MGNPALSNDGRKYHFHSSSDDLLWKVVIADSDRSTHQRIKRILGSHGYNDRGIRIYSAYSAEEALDLLSMHPNAAVLIYNTALDLEISDFDIKHHVRVRHNNINVRIILIQGTLNELLEKRSTEEYDISGFIDLSELECGRLSSVVASSLKDFNDNMNITKIKNGLGTVLNSINDLSRKSAQDFSSGVLTQLLACMNIGENAVYCRKKTDGDDGEFYVASAAGKYEKHINKNISDIFPEDLVNEMENAVNKKNGELKGNFTVFGPEGDRVGDWLIMIQDYRSKGAPDGHLMGLYNKCVASFLDTVNYYSNMIFFLKEAIIIVNLSNNIIYYNNSFYETFGRFTGIRKGMAMGEFLGNLDRFVVKNEDKGYCMNILGDLDVGSTEGEIRIRSGSEKIFSFSIRTMADITGASTGRVIAFYDITGSKVQIEHLQNEYNVMSKLNEKSETIVNSIRDQAIVKSEESQRLISNFAGSVLGISVEILLLLKNSVMYRNKFCKRIEGIIDMINHELTDINMFVSNMEQKRSDFYNAFKKLAMDMNSHKVLKIKETGLDEREIVILQMIAECKSNKEIAKELNYEEETIKNKITVIRRKLRLKDRCHLVSYAFRNGLI